MVKNQHYVPQFYLRNFSHDGSSIALCTLKGRKIVPASPIKNICSEKFFYDKNNFIESQLSKKESGWAELIKNFSAKLTDNELDTLREFIAYQLIRTRGILNHAKKIAKVSILEIAKSCIPDLANISEEDSRKILSLVNDTAEEKAADIITSAWLLKGTQDILLKIRDLRLCVLDNHTRKNFITSDAPVIVVNPFCTRQAGLSVVGAVIILPISPRRALMLYDDKVYSLNPDSYALNEDDVTSINKYTFLNAEEIVMAYDVTDINALISTKNLLSEKEENDKLRPPETLSNDNSRGEILHTKSRAVWKNYPLNFLTLPECLNDMVEMCREAFPRKYSIDSRICILLRIYLLPEEVEAKISAGAKELFPNEDIEIPDSKALKRSWEILLKFMDNYWAVSDKDKELSRKLVEHNKHKVKLSYIKSPRT